MFDLFLIYITALPVASFTPGLSDLQRGILFLALYPIYFIGFEGLFSRTPGKMLCGLKVAKLSGGSITWVQSIVRNLMRVLEANPVLFGLLPGGLAVAWSKKSQRFGDMLAGTVVVHSKT
jgi:uncharacterized RDD family membrane protein YckC